MVNRTFSDPNSAKNVKRSKGARPFDPNELQRSRFIPASFKTPDAESTFTNIKVNENLGTSTSNNTEFFVPQSTAQQQSVVNQYFAQFPNTVTEQNLNRLPQGTQVQQAPSQIDVESPFDPLIQRIRNNDLTQQLTNEFSSNILNNYENVTYNFKLMIGREDILLDTDVTPNGDLYTIAQSGVTTTFNIQDVEIESVVGPNSRTRNTQATLFRIGIAEPQGISLIDRLLQAGQELNIKNIMNAPIFLELRFKGWANAGQKVEVDIARRLWRIQLIDIATTMDSAGSIYNLSFVNVNDFGFHRFASASRIKQQLSFGVETIGDFFDNLGYYLTLQDALLASSGEQTRNEYEFVVDPEMESWRIGQADSEPNAPSMFVDQDGKRSVVIEPGKRIEEIVDNVLSTTTEMEVKANPASVPNKLNEPQKGDQVSKIAIISCEVRYIGFNENNNEYIRKYVYYINFYDAIRALPEKPTQTGQDQRIAYLKQESMRKRYSYIFTGDNTEVLNLDIDLNNMWRQAVTYYTHAMHRTNNISSNFLSVETRDLNNPDDVRQERQEQGFQPGLKDNPFGTVGSTSINSPNNIIDAETNLDARTVLTDRLQKLRDARAPNTVALEETLASLDTLDEIVPLEEGTNTNLGTIGDAASNRIGGRLSSSDSDSLELLSGQNSRSRLLTPIRTFNRGVETTRQSRLLESTSFISNRNILNFFIRQTDPALDVSVSNKNIEETTQYNRSIFGIIANQMYGEASADLLNIEMQVRGDPYWLGETDSEINRRLRARATREASNGTFANYLRGENSFLLTFKTPKNYDENTGFIELEDSTTFVGVYTVVQVLHQFSQGNFTQTISAIRDMNTDAVRLKSLTR